MQAEAEVGPAMYWACSYARYGVQGSGMTKDMRLNYAVQNVNIEEEQEIEWRYYDYIIRYCVETMTNTSWEREWSIMIHMNYREQECEQRPK